QMLAMTSPDDTYIIFCDHFDRSLNTDQSMSYWRDYVGDNIAKVLNGDLVNEFCVMDLNGQIIAGASLNFHANTTGTPGCIKGGWQCINEGACDANKCLVSPPDAFIPPEKSFLEMLKGDDGNDYCNNVMSDTDGFYHACTDNDVYYNAKLQTILFTKPHETNAQFQSVPLEPELSLIGEVFQFLADFLRELLGIAGVPRPINEMVNEAQFDFIRNAGSFNRLYISFDPEGPDGNPREIKGIVETRAHRKLDNTGVEIRTFITIDYLNYQAPICKYFFQHNLPHLQRQISYIDAAGIHCAPVILDDEQWKYTVFIEKPRFGEIQASDIAVREWRGAADVFWNDMTAKIRTKPVREGQNRMTPQTPLFTYAPSDNPVAGVPIVFSLETNPNIDEYFIAQTYEFGDDKFASSVYNVTTRHIYEEAKSYQPKVRVMNQYYRIATSDSVPITVNVGPSVTIDELEQIVDGQLRLNISFHDAEPPVNFLVDWNDAFDEDDPVDEFDNYDPLANPWTVVSHAYEFDGNGGLDPVIRIEGTAGTFPYAAPFDNQKRVVVWANANQQAFEIEIAPLVQVNDEQARINISFANVTDPPLYLTIDWRDYLKSGYQPEEIDPPLDYPPNLPNSHLISHIYTFDDQLALQPVITITGRDHFGHPYFGQQIITVEKNITS
ncbi:PKD domain-containing protein, partial [Nanoarchaeota archaeon]